MSNASRDTHDLELLASVRTEKLRELGAPWLLTSYACHSYLTKVSLLINVICVSSCFHLYVMCEINYDDDDLMLHDSQGAQPQKETDNLFSVLLVFAGPVQQIIPICHLSILRCS